MRCLLVLSILMCSIVVLAQTKYTDFKNYVFEGLPVQVNSFVEDIDGQLWFGTSQGLYSYDGKTARCRVDEGGQVYSLIIVGDTVFIGADEGLLKMDIPSGETKMIDKRHCHTIRAMLMGQEGKLYLGAADGLFCYSDGQLIQINDNSSLQLSNSTIYSLASFDEDNIFIGTYNGLCLFNQRHSRITNVDIPFYINKSNCFVNSLLADSLYVWIGLEGELLRYSKKQCKVERTDIAYGNSIKSLAKDIYSNLLIGTDNGLFVLDTTEHLTHIVHNAKYSNSLVGNIVWSLFSDRQGNVWIGSDYGVSMADMNDRFTSVSEITGLPDGNTFYAIMSDCHNRLWLGGSNGLLKTDENLQNPVWYRLGDKDNALPHNRIRDIKEDKEGVIWIASDGGVNRYDENSKCFIRYNIEDTTGVYNANWAYQITDDGVGKLWIATCQGGVMVVDKSKFNSGGSHIEADFVITKTNGLANNYIEQLQYDKGSYMYALCHRAGVYRIDMTTRIATGIGYPLAMSIYSDSVGSLWIGEEGRLINIKSDGTERILNLAEGVSVFAMCEEQGYLWVMTSNGLWLVENETVRKYMTDKHTYMSLHVDGAKRRLYAGGIDGVMSVSSVELKESKLPDMKVFITSVYVGDSLYAKACDYRYLESLKLDYKDNRLAFDVSDFNYSEYNNSSFVYRMEGLDEQWHEVQPDESRIYYSGLSHGKFVLHVGKQLSDNTYRTDFSLPIVIEPPFYLSFWAYVGYMFVIVSILVWIMFFYNLKHRLRIEHIEKVKTLEQTKIKIDFFTNVSHEFKTPMSMIIAPLSNALSKINDYSLKRDVETALRNARQLNSMINRALNFARIDNNLDDQSILSPIDIVEFSKSVFNMHKQTTSSADVEWIFETTAEKAFVNVDAVKMESLLNNLLSNACKYTEKGYVKLSLCINNELLLIVSDSGIGIPQDELPNVFQKFYRSSKTETRDDSTGIGLYLVKQYVETFGGTIEVSSDGQCGTQFAIRLPLVAEHTEQQINGGKYLSHNDANGVKILIVEDNVQIAEFIASIFAENYNVTIAHNGQMGLDISKVFRPDIVIADVMMPIMDGMEMARRMKKTDPTKETPIVMLTAKNDRQTESESLRYCVDVFMSKPFEPQQLILRVEQLLKARRATESRLRIENITEAKPIVAVSADEKFLSKMVEFIDKHMSDSDFNVNALADMMATSPKQLYRKVKALTGQTPVEYISGIRMKKAAMLLSQGSFTVAEVMYMVGFSNHSYFAKCFASSYGMTPKQYIGKSNLSDTSTQIVEE